MSDQTTNWVMKFINYEMKLNHEVDNNLPLAHLARGRFPDGKPKVRNDGGQNGPRHFEEDILECIVKNLWRITPFWHFFRPFQYL